MSTEAGRQEEATTASQQHVVSLNHIIISITITPFSQLVSRLDVLKSWAKGESPIWWFRARNSLREQRSINLNWWNLVNYTCHNDHHNTFTSPYLENSPPMKGYVHHPFSIHSTIISPSSSTAYNCFSPHRPLFILAKRSSTYTICPRGQMIFVRVIKEFLFSRYC